jgi:hypothetical protein
MECDSVLLAVTDDDDDDDDDDDGASFMTDDSTLAELMADLEIMGDAAEVNDEVAFYLQRCAVYHSQQKESQQEDGKCKISSAFLTDSVFMIMQDDDEEANLQLADVNCADNEQSEELQQWSANVWRVIKQDELHFAPETLFWGSEHDKKEMEVLLKLQLRAKKDMNERKQSPIVGAVWSDGEKNKRASELELKADRTIHHLAINTRESIDPNSQ